MPITSGFDHVATITADLDRIVSFYQAAFDAEVRFEMQAEGDHPRMVILDLGGGSAMNIFEMPAESIVGDRTRIGGRGPVDHYGIAVPTRADLETVERRLHDLGTDTGEIQALGDTWSLFFRDPDGMELEVCTPIRPDA